MKNKITIDTKNLQGLKKAFAKGGFVKVGVLSGDASRDETINNAELGAVQEFGSLSKNIPPRSFLRMPIETKKDDIESVGATKSFQDAIETGDLDRALTLIGLKGEEIVNNAFTSSGFGQWAANASATVAKKKSSKPLIDTGQLRRAISSEVVSGKET